MTSNQMKRLCNIAARIERRAASYVGNSIEIAQALSEQADDELANRQAFIEHSKNIITTPGAALAMILK